MSFNKTIVVGNLGRDPEMRYSQEGKPICTFSVATSRKRKGEETTTWFRVTCFGRLAEVASQYLAKGKQVYVDGPIELHEYQAKDGTVKQSLELTANDIQFLGGTTDDNRHQTAPPLSTRAATAPAPFKAEEVSDDDVPF